MGENKRSRRTCSSGAKWGAKKRLTANRNASTGRSVKTKAKGTGGGRRSDVDFHP